MPTLAPRTTPAPTADWIGFGRAALAALGTLATLPRSRARDHLTMPALRVARALGLPLPLVRSAWGQGVGDDLEELRARAEEAIERLQHASTPEQRREALASIRALNQQVERELARVQRVATASPAQRGTAERVRDILESARALVREAADATGAVLRAANPTSGFGGLAMGTVLGIGAVIALLVFGRGK